MVNMWSMRKRERETVWLFGDLWPLWFCFIWIGIAPFVSLYRVGPLSSFYLEAGSLVGACVLVLLTALFGRLNVRLPSASVYFLVLAAFWWLQARLMGLMFPGFSDMAVWSFVVIALMAWAARGWVVAVGQSRVVAVLAWVLMIGALLQGFVALLQFTGWASEHIFQGIVSYRGLRDVAGQVGQRNHLGHYLMWGTLSAAYLWAERRVPNWLGVLLVLLLTGALGLVNSRTIFTYVMGVGGLLVFWRVWAGRDARRVTWIMAFTLLMTMVVQVGLNPLIAWFSGVHYDSALDRIQGSSFAASARDYEWRKAWLVFKSAPVLGHGWGSYSLQGFLVDVSPNQYSGNVLGVLFTHCHNIVLQLLAEMGLIGTVLVFAGLLLVVMRMLRRCGSGASLLLLAMMTVSLCHSMLEYPLWYVYFLVPVGLMISLSPADEGDILRLDRPLFQNVSMVSTLGGLLAVILLLGILRLGGVYTALVNANKTEPENNPVAVQEKIETLRGIAANEPLLRYYALLSLTRKADPASDALQPWADQAARQALLFRPYANAYQIGLYKYRDGEQAAAKEWLQKMYYYYPSVLPFYAKKIRSQAALQGLYPQVMQSCYDYAKVNAQAKSCEAQ